MALAPRSLHRSQSLHEQTYQTLRTAILSGELDVGQRLVETQLAERLQVSRTPIREAIRQLQRDHLVSSDAQGNLRVATLSSTDAIYLYDCRLALEQIAVSHACQIATGEQLQALEQMVQQAEQIGTEDTHQILAFQRLHLDYQFHRLIAESSANPWLVFLLDQVFDKMMLLRIRTLQHNPGVLEICSEHRYIYQAIADRNAEAAIQAIQSHLRASKTRVIQEVQQLEQAIEAAQV